MAGQIPNKVGPYAHSLNHRTEIDASGLCGCFHCLSTFPPTAIVDWTEEVGSDGTETDDGGTTALCPKCGVDSVIGDASGYPVDAAFLNEMRLYRFR